jgi:hypothetical protein
VPPGEAIDVGVPGIFSAYSALQAGRRVDVTGATGKLDFDLEHGETAFDYSILCAGSDDHGVPSGLVYTASTRHLTGELRCP